MKKNPGHSSRNQVTTVTIRAEGFSFLQFYINRGKNTHIWWTFVKE